MYTSVGPHIHYQHTEDSKPVPFLTVFEIKYSRFTAEQNAELLAQVLNNIKRNTLVVR